MLTSAKKGIFFFLLLSLEFALLSHEPNRKPGQGGFNMYANIWNPPKRGWHTGVFHCTTLSVTWNRDFLLFIIIIDKNPNSEE